MAVQRRSFYSREQKMEGDSRDYICPECGVEMVVVDSGDFRGVTWENLECPECGFEVNEEPDWDYMSECEGAREW